MTAPRGHHLVAQLYQRGFARQRGKVWQVRVIERATGVSRVTNVADTFKRRDWNTILDEDGTKEFVVEELLAEAVDTPAAPVFEALRGDRFPLTADERWLLAQFMSAQLTRGRHARENLAQFMVENQRHMLALTAEHYTDEDWIRAIGEVPSAELREQLIHSERHFDIRPTNAGLLGALLSNVEEVAAFFMPRTWTLVRFAEPCLFTSEHPVTYINPSGAPMGYGVATTDQVYLPVSTRHGLVLSHPWGGWPEALVTGTVELARRLNWAVMTFPASDELLLHPDVARHPLPRTAELADASDWPWLWPSTDHGGGGMPEYWQRALAARSRARTGLLQ